MEIEKWYNVELRPADLANKATKPPILPEVWQEAVRDTLSTILVSEVGLLLLRSIRRTGHWLILQPYWWIADELFPPPRARGADTLPIRRVEKERTYASLVRFSPQLYFSPQLHGRRTPCEACRGQRLRAVQEPHEVLFHELVHGLRMLSGTRLPEGGDQLRGGLRAHNNTEEFIAILVTNIYASRNRKTTLRGGHYTSTPDMPEELEGSFKFFQIGAKAFTLIEEFCKANPDFCKGLAQVEALFNPIKAYFDDPQKARRLSESARAQARDARGEVFGMLRFFLWDYDNFEKFLAD